MMGNHPTRRKISNADRAEMARLRSQLREASERYTYGAISAFDAGQMERAIVKRIEDATAFELATIPVVHEQSGIVVGLITYVHDSNDTHRRTETKTLEQCRAGLFLSTERAIDVWTSVMRDVRSGSSLRFAANRLALVRRVIVPPSEVLEAIAAVYAEHWRTPDQRAPLEDVMRELERIRDTTMTGRGFLTLAAQRVLDKQPPSMVLGAMM